DIECAPDAADAPPGPAAGVFTVARRLSLKRDGPDGFVTAPVDGPNLPDDLVERLLRGGGCAVAADGEHVHPTFAYWTIAALQATEPAFRASGSPSLLRLAELTGAVRVVWPNAAAFANINSHEDLERLTLDAPHTPASD
ncbi:MAG: NTP transferase domain-containing protein, partial [Parvularculaceae bacterium]